MGATAPAADIPRHPSQRVWSGLRGCCASRGPPAVHPPQQSRRLWGGRGGVGRYRRRAPADCSCCPLPLRMAAAAVSAVRRTRPWWWGQGGPQNCVHRWSVSFFFFFLNEMKSHTLYSALLERPHAHQVTGRGGHTDGPKEGGRGKTVLFGAHALFPQRVDVDKVHLRLTRVCAQRGRLLLSVQHSPHLLPRFYCWHECTRICGA